ncbi:GntR family transcriptional regulator [Streptomyces noursei ATCC 11455]|nr:GntR family transcriptional regulator [Streptomyces noursei ATCC 11455]
MDRLGDALRRARGGIAYLVPDFQNPTGALMAARTRHAVAELAARHEVVLVVDETMRDLDLRHDHSPEPRMRQAILIGSASKTVWGGLRVGWIRGSAQFIGELSSNPLCGSLSAAPMQQMVAVELLSDLDTVVARRRTELRGQRDYLSGLLTGDDRWRFAVPPGGLSLWMRLVNARADMVVERARAHRLDLVPGPHFAADATLTRYLRVPFTPPPSVLDRVAAVLKEGLY